MRRYDTYKDSGIEWIGHIPGHWEVKKANYCFKQIGSGTTPTAGKPEYYNNGEFNWLQTGDLNDGEILETSKKVTQEALNDYSTLRFYPIDSLVIAMYGATIGKTGLLKIESTTNQACCVLSNPIGVNHKFAFYWLNYIKPHVISLSYGGGQPNINQEQIRSLKIQCPSIYEQTAIAAYLDRKTGEIDALIADKKRMLALYEEEKRDEFKKGLRTWTNLYSFLAQIMPFQDAAFEKFYAYAKLLQTRLPKRDLAESLQLDDELALEYYRLQKVKEGSIDLITGEDGEISGITEAGLKKSKDEEATLSEIIGVLNERFGTEFEEADKLFFEQIETELMQDETLQTQAKVNKLDTFKYAFEDTFLSKLIERMDQNQEIFEKILEDKDFGSLVKELMMKKIYRKMNE